MSRIGNKAVEIPAKVKVNVDGSGKVAVVAYLTPIASTLLLTLSGERLTITAIAGAVLVIGSCIAVGVERSEAGNHA